MLQVLRKAEDKENEFTHLSRHKRISKNMKNTKTKGKESRLRKIYVVIIKKKLIFFYSMNVHVKLRDLIFSLYNHTIYVDMKRKLISY